MRYAVVTGRGTAEAVARYLPEHYALRASVEANGTVVALIQGEDEAGWTLGEYVLERLASGLYFGREYETHDEAYFVLSTARGLVPRS